MARYWERVGMTVVVVVATAIMAWVVVRFEVEVGDLLRSVFAG